MTDVQLADGTKIRVSDTGQGPVILLVHGFPLDHTMWVEQIRELQTDFRVIAPDLRGFGESGSVEGTLTMDQLAVDLAELLDQLDINEPIVLCGLSMGGYVAFRFLERFRDRLGGVVFCDTRAAADNEDGVQNRLRVAEVVSLKGPAAIVDGMIEKLFASSTLSERTEVVDATRTVIMNAASSSIAAASRGMAERPDSTEMLTAIDLPTLWICGVDDQITTLEEMRGLAGQTPNGQLVEVANAGHMAPLEAPDVVNAALRRFVRESLTE